jgi:hypothetical protein
MSGDDALDDGEPQAAALAGMRAPGPPGTENTAGPATREVSRARWGEGDPLGPPASGACYWMLHASLPLQLVLP